MLRIFCVFWFNILLGFSIIPIGWLFAQEALVGSTLSRADTTMEKEIILEEIHIEAVIEKPNVTLIPKRVEPEVGSVPLVLRSFEVELEAGIDTSNPNTKKFQEPQKATDIKKYLAKKKK